MRLMTSALLLTFLILCNQEAHSQIEDPFVVDEHTLALWHMDDCPPDSQWSVALGGEGRNLYSSAIRSTDGNYLVAGLSILPENGGSFYSLVKMSNRGEVLWSETYGGSVGKCFDVAQMDNGNIILVGNIPLNRQYDALVIVVNEEGDSLWSSTYGGNEENDYFYSVLADDDEIVLGGFTESEGAGMSDMWVVKVDSEGEVIWSSTFGGESVDNCKDIISTPDDGYLSVGTSLSFGDAGQAYVVKINRNGVSIWEETYGGELSEDCKSISRTDSGYVGAGNIYGPDVDSDNWLFRINEDGELLWETSFGSENNDKLYDVIISMDGNFLMAGQQNHQGGIRSMFGLTKVNPEGEFLWTQCFGGDHVDIAKNVFQEEDGSYTLFGRTSSFGEGTNNFWVINAAHEVSGMTDSSEFGNHGELGGNARWWKAPWREEKWKTGLRLSPDGDGYLSIPDHESLRPQSFTLECWFNIDTTIENTGYLVVKSSGEEIPSYGLFASNLNNNVGFSIGTAESEFVIEHDIDTVDGEWHYIAGTYDGNWMRLYYDGQPVQDLDVGDALLHGPGPLVIGSGANDPGIESPFYGLIDEVRISDYQREYLSIYISENEKPVPGIFNLISFPNPFNNTVGLQFILNHETKARLSIYDLNGVEIGVLVNKLLPMGRQAFYWNAVGMPSGIYFVKLTAHQQSQFQKITLSK